MATATNPKKTKTATPPKADLSSLNPEALELAGSYYKFFKAFWPEVSKEDLRLNWHIKLIAEELETVGRWIINKEKKKYDLIINIPPGSSKSTLATILFPVWLWVNAPWAKIISGSFSEPLSINHAAASRDCIRSEKFQRLFGDIVQIRGDFDAKTLYKTTQGGQRYVTAARSSVIGEHGHVIIVDDPVDPKGAASAATLDTVNAWFEKTLPSRVIDKERTPIILIMQRLHQNDPAGRLLKVSTEQGVPVRHICLPAVAGATVTDEDGNPVQEAYPISPADQPVDYRGKTLTVRERYARAGGLLDPVRMPPAVLATFKARLGSAEFGGQFGQSPRASEGNIFKRGWFQVISRADYARSRAYLATKDFTADTAYKEKQSNDPSGCLAYTQVGNYLFLTDYLSGRFAFPKLLKELETFVRRNGNAESRMYVEPKASGVSVVQSLREWSNISVIEAPNPEGDKEARAHSITGPMESMRLFLVEGPWTESFIDSCLVFPRGEHDEEVDCLVMAVKNTIQKTIEEDPGGGYGHYK